LDNSLGNPINTATTLSKWEIIDIHNVFFWALEDEEYDHVPLLYWIQNLHKCPYAYKQHYITSAAKCSTKPLSKLFSLLFLQLSKWFCWDIMLPAFLEVSLMKCWFKKNSKYLEILSSRSQYVCNTLKYGFLQLIYHMSQLQSRLKELIQHCFSKKNAEQRYHYLIIGISYFVKSHIKYDNKYKQDEICQILYFFNW